MFFLKKKKLLLLYSQATTIFENQVKEGKDALGEGANIVPTKNNLDEEKQQLDCSKMSQPYIFKSFLQHGRTIAATFIVVDASLKRGDDKDQGS